jgi:hypothetical protein
MATLQPDKNGAQIVRIQADAYQSISEDQPNPRHQRAIPTPISISPEQLPSQICENPSNPSNPWSICSYLNWPPL